MTVTDAMLLSSSFFSTIMAFYWMIAAFRGDLARYDRERERDYARAASDVLQRGIESAQQVLRNDLDVYFRKDRGEYGTFDEASLALAQAVLDHDKTAARAIHDYLNERPELLAPLAVESESETP